VCAVEAAILNSQTHLGFRNGHMRPRIFHFLNPNIHFGLRRRHICMRIGREGAGVQGERIVGQPRYMRRMKADAKLLGAIFPTQAFIDCPILPACHHNDHHRTASDS